MLRPLLLRQYLDVLDGLGFDKSYPISDTRIALADIADPGYRVAFGQYLRLFENLARCSSVPGIGFEFGLRTTLADSGPLGDATRFCHSVRESMERLWAPFGATFGMMASPRFDDGERSTVSIEFSLPSMSRAANRMCVEDALSRIAGTGTAVAGARAAFEKLFIAYPAPDYAARYHAIFQCPVVFNAPRTRAVVRRAWIEQPLKTHDGSRFAAYLQGLSAFDRSVRDGSPLPDRIRERLLRSESRRLPAETAVAAEIGLSRRSFCRVLRDGGTRYRDIVEEVRVERAMRSLDFDAATAKQAAFAAGYADLSAFRRAFKKSTGLTVGEYAQGRTSSGGSQ